MTATEHGRKGAPKEGHVPCERRCLSPWGRGHLTSAAFSFALFLVAAFLLSGASADAMVLDRVVAVVNQEAITWLELYRAMEFDLGASVSGLSDEQKARTFAKSEAQYLENMVDVKVQLAEAREAGISVGADEVDRAVRDIQKKYSMDDETFRKALEREGLTMEAYRKKLREQITIARLVEREVRSTMNVTDEEIQERMKEDGLKGEILYHLRQIFFRLPEGEGMEAVEPELARVHEGLKAGTPFEELARQYSQGPARDKGGDLGYMKKSKMDGAFRDAVQGMSAGEVSEPFRTARGVHIVQLVEKKEPTETVREQIFQEKYRQWLKGLRAKAFVEIKL